MRNPSKAVPRADRGSIPIALVLVILLAATSIVIAGTVLSGQKQSRDDVAFEKALRSAEIGMDRLVADVKGQPLAPDGTELTVPATVDPATGLTYKAKAVKSGNVWTITAEGTDGSALSRRIERAVSIGTTFDLALYAKTGIMMNGANSADSFDSDVPLGNAKCVQGNTVRMCSPTGNGRIGTEGDLNLKGNTGTAVDGVDIFFAKQYLLPPGVVALPGATGDCTGSGSSPCPNIKAHREHYAVPEMAVCDAATYTDSWTGKLKPGLNSYAETDITLSEQSMPSLAPGERVILCARGTLTLDGHDKGINMGDDGNPSPPSQLFIFLSEAGGSDPALNALNHCEISAAIFAPNASFGTGKSNAQCDIYGSMIINSYSSVGGVGFHYDDALGRVPVNVPVTVGGWRELG